MQRSPASCHGAQYPCLDSGDSGVLEEPWEHSRVFLCLSSSYQGEQINTFETSPPPPMPIDPHCLVALICLYSHPRAGRSWCPGNASQADDDKGGSHALLRPCLPSTLLEVEHGAQCAR